MSATSPALLAAVGVAIFMAGIASAAAAPPSHITLIGSPEAGPATRDCLTRIREELVAGGFVVSMIDPGPKTDPVSLAEMMEQRQGTVATVALVGEPGQRGAELWILDRVGAVPEVRRVPATGEDREHLPEVLAIRTIEILRASALKVLVESTRPSTAASAFASPRAAVPPAALASTSDAAPPRARTFGLEAGVSLLTSVGGAGPAALPIGRLRAKLGDWVSARLTLAGLGSRPRVENAAGSASIDQALGLAELAIALRPGRRLRPTVSLGGGAFYFESEGAGTWPALGRRATRFVGAIDAGVGLLANTKGDLSFAFEVHAVLALPHPTVQFFEVQAATLAFPAIFASLTMVAWL